MSICLHHENVFESHNDKCCGIIRVALSGLRQFLTAEGTFKVMKNAFYFTLKPLSVLKIDMMTYTIWCEHGLNFCLDFPAM